jgi:hypothetical protein
MPAKPDGRRDRQRVESPTSASKTPHCRYFSFFGYQETNLWHVVVQAPTSEFVPYLTISGSYLNDF